MSHVNEVAEYKMSDLSDITIIDVGSADEPTPDANEVLDVYVSFVPDTSSKKRASKSRTRS